jgi:amidohydrolase
MLDETRRLVADVMRDAGITVRELAGGLVADLGEAPRVLLRADMDALPVRDGKVVPYASGNEGKCHACGHDGHMAMLYGAALLLKEKEAPGVRLVFQPAEECPPGGALGMVEAGVMEGIEAAFALHLDPSLPLGTVGIKEGVLMAAADNFCLRIGGKSGHGARPQGTVDSILVASHVVTALQSLVSRGDPLEPLVVTVGRFQGGTAPNVIAGETVLEGTVRTLREELRRELPGMIQRVAEGVCASFGASCELEYLFGYPVLRNDGDMAWLAAEVAAEVLGGDKVVWLERPVMGSEDFAYFLTRAPGCFLFLGIGKEEYDYPLHHPFFDFDEGILPAGAELLAGLAAEFKKT